MQGGKIVGPIANGSHVSISYTLFRFTSKLSSFSKIVKLSLKLGLFAQLDPSRLVTT